MKKIIEIKILNPLIGNSIPVPSYATKGSAGIDLRACIKESEIINPGETTIIKSGLAININDPSIMAVITPRSGLGIKHGIVLGNLIGICDSDYQGEITIGLWNRGDIPFTINQGDRICQMIFVPVIPVAFETVKEFSVKTKRDTGGLGHTGLR